MDNHNIPKIVHEAFPTLTDARFVRQMASLVPFAPDTVFDIYLNDDNKYIALIITDYADPHHQSYELKNIPSQRTFEFSSLIKPYDKANGKITITENDNMDYNFFVTAPYKNHQLYYYVANLK